MPIFVPNIPKLTNIFSTGTLGISNAMFASHPEITLPNSNSPGLPNFEKTILKTMGVSFQPVITVIEVVGNILNAAQTLIQSPPTEWIDLIANNIAAPVADAVGLIANFLPPSVDSFSNLLLSPITTNLQLPLDKFYFPSANWIPLENYESIIIPFPSFGNNTNPSFPNYPGEASLPPNLKVILGLVSFPVNFLLQVFEPIKLALESITDPTKIADTITTLLNLPSTLIPSPTELLNKILGYIGIPEENFGAMLSVFQNLMNSFVTGILEILLAILGLDDE